MLLQGRIKTNNFIEEEIELLEEMNNFARRENLTLYHLITIHLNMIEKVKKVGVKSKRRYMRMIKDV